MVLCREEEEEEEERSLIKGLWVVPWHSPGGACGIAGGRARRLCLGCRVFFAALRAAELGVWCRVSCQGLKKGLGMGGG